MQKNFESEGNAIKLEKQLKVALVNARHKVPEGSKCVTKHPKPGVPTRYFRFDGKEELGTIPQDTELYVYRNKVDGRGTDYLEVAYDNKKVLVPKKHTILFERGPDEPPHSELLNQGPW